MADPVGPQPPRVRVLYSGSVVIDAGWAHPLRSPFWRLYLNDAPGAEVVFPGGAHPLAPDRIHLVPAWGEFDGRSRAAVRHHYLHVDPGEPLRDLARLPVRAARRFRRPLALARDAALEGRLRAVATAPLRSALWWLRAEAVAVAAVVLCLEQLPAAERDELERLATGDDLAARAARCVDDQPWSRVTVAALARACGYSAAHFGKELKRRTGLSPAAFVRRRRIAMAAERLLATADPIEAVAADSGFANRFHFSRVFARTMGVGPAAYRRQGR